MKSSIGHFSIYGAFDAEEITTALGMQPSNVNPKGTWYEGANYPSRVEEWEIYCPEDLTMGQQIDYLLTKLWPSASALEALARKYHADLNISGEGSEVLEISPEALLKLSQCHVHLNCFFNTGDVDAD